MKKIIFFTILLVWVIFLPAVAQIRTHSQIQKLAQEHFANHLSRNTRSLSFHTIAASAILQTKGLQAVDEAFYVATTNDEFVIISGDERMRSTLGYSHKEGFDPNRIPRDLRWLLSIYTSEFNHLQSTNEKMITTRTATTNYSLPMAVSSLLSPKGINFNQNAPYNNMCPEFNGQRAVTGCVPTAMAMVMMYHEYPARALNKAEGIDIDITERPLDWENIKQLNTSAGQDAVAWLMLVCGKTVGATYGVIETTAADSKIRSSLIDYFDYDAGMKFHRRDVYSTVDWENLLKKEVSEGRPVVYGGQSALTAGHCFVLDGYDANNLFHINWGWSGSMNNYYALSSLRPGFSGPGSSIGGYNISQTATTGIQKSTNSTSITSHFILFDSGITLSNTNIQRNGTFNIAEASYINQGNTFTGSLQAALYKNGELVTLLGNPAIITNVAYKDSKSITLQNIAIPSEITNGNYQLRIVTKDNRENQWQFVRMPQTTPYYYDVNVSGVGIVFSNQINLNGLIQQSFTRENNLYVNYGIRFKLTIKNDGSEWMGRLGVRMQKVGNLSESTVIAQDRVVFKEGINAYELYDESARLTVGNYNMQSVFSSNGIQWNVLPGSNSEAVTVETPDLNGFNIVMKSGGPIRNSLTEKDKVQFLLDLENTGTGPFSSTFRFVIYNKNTAQIYTSGAHSVFIDKGTRKSVILNHDNTLPDGDYNIDIFYVNNQVGKKYLIERGGNFTVRSLTGFKF